MTLPLVVLIPRLLPACFTAVKSQCALPATVKQYTNLVSSEALLLHDYIACGHVKTPPIPFKRLSTLYFPCTYPQPEAFCKLTTYHQITIMCCTSSRSLHIQKTDGRGSKFSHRKRSLPNFWANYFVACDSEAVNQKDTKGLQQFISHYNCVDIITLKLKHYI